MARAAPSPLLPLTSALVPLRTSAGAGVQATALPHVIAAINGLLDCGLPRFWSLSRACEANLLSLLPRLVARGISTGVDPFYWRYECDQGLVYAVKHDNMEMIEWLHGCCPSVLPYNAMVEAAKTGNMRLLEWLSDHHERVVWLTQMMDAAASTGEVEMLGWLHNHPKNGGCTRDAVHSAVRGGHLNTVKWLCEHFRDVGVNGARRLVKQLRMGIQKSPNFFSTTVSGLTERICLLGYAVL